jgi:hypothetical protein
MLRNALLAVCLSVSMLPDAGAQGNGGTGGPEPLARGHRTRTLAGGWGHSWLHGWPGYGKAISDIQYVGFYPQIGWFVADWLELSEIRQAPPRSCGFCRREDSC